MRIAIIGSGISGLVCAYLLNQKHNVTVFEANTYLGGHTHTVDVAVAGQNYAIDTGFIVFNDRTYPNFQRLLQKLAVPFDKTEMSFSFRSDVLGLEYNGHSLNTLFADRRNLLKPKFYQMLSDIVKFNKDAKAFLIDTSKHSLSLNDFLAQHQYHDWFNQAYLLPMVAAIWSANPRDALTTPAYFILNFFLNHGLIDITNRPQWYVIKGGSRNYITPLIATFKDSIKLKQAVTRVKRTGSGVRLYTESGEADFDNVVIATHSPEALAMLDAPSDAEREILGSMRYQTTQVILHHDASVLPRRALSRASWNYTARNGELPTLTYYMNRLQNLQTPIDFCVSLNQKQYINPEMILQEFQYAHPVFDNPAVSAQTRFAAINGTNKIFYCGAYWGSGFHEDGVNSALAVADMFGLSL